MTWLEPAIIASIATSVIITLTYSYIYLQYRQLNFVLWTVSWILAILRFVIILFMIHYPPHPHFIIASELFSIYHAIFLALGISTLIHKKYTRIWILLSIPVSLWLIIAVLLGLPFLSYTLPAYLLSGTAFIISGIMFIRIYKVKGRMNYLVGITLILHGIHKFDYPFLRNVTEFAATGFLINSMFTLLVAFGIILLFYEKEHRELADSENLLSSLFTHSPLAIMLTDQSGKLLTFNNKFFEIFHYTIQDIDSPEKWFNHAYPDPQYRQHVLEEFHSAVAQLDTKLNPAPKEFQVCDKYGIFHSIEFHYTRVGDNLLFILNDLTEKKKIEDELFNIRKVESLGVLAGGIAHDFNNILTAISGNIELASMACDPGSEISGFLENSQKALNRASALSQQLLTFSKSNITETEIFNIKDIIEETTRFVLTGSNVSSQIEMDSDLWPIEANKGQISQVINNLVINAVQAMPEGGRISIRAANSRDTYHTGLSEGDYIRIDVSDQGPGIPQAIIDKIFDPYFTTKETGSGLGLATSYSIISRFKGKILCHNNPDQGCTFAIYLPAILDRAPAPKNMNHKQSRQISGSASILVIDDDTAILNLLEKYLSDEGFTVITALDGQAGLARIEACHNNGKEIQLVITDMTIPGKMGGLEFLENLKKTNPEIPVILISGYAEAEDIEEFYKKGFKKFIQKPFRLNQIMEAIREILESA